MEKLEAVLVEIRMNLLDENYSKASRIAREYEGYGYSMVEVFNYAIRTVYMGEGDYIYRPYYDFDIRDKGNQALEDVLVFDAIPASFLVSTDSKKFTQGGLDATKYYLDKWRDNLGSDYVLIAAKLNAVMKKSSEKDFWDTSHLPYIGWLMLLRDYYSVSLADDYLNLVKLRMEESGYASHTDKDLSFYKKVNEKLAECP